MKAIVYTTNAGSTEQYAKLLAQETGLPVYSLAEAKRTLSSGTEIVYLGWIMASTVKGYADAAKRYRICAVCAIGMGQTGTQIAAESHSFCAQHRFVFPSVPYR